MDNIDIVTLVIKELAHGRRIAGYAAVSSLFKDVVESITFKHVTLTSSTEQKSKFTAVFHPSRGRRRSILRSIQLYVELPTRGQTDDQYRQNEEHLLAATSFLLHELYRWERTLPEDNLGRIAVNIALSEGLHTWTDAEAERDEHYRVRLHEDDVNKLPIVKQIVKLEHNTGCWDALHAAALFRLASRCPNLEVIECGYLDGDHDQPGLRLEQHHGLAQAIEALQGKVTHLKKLKIEREGGSTPLNQSYRCLNMEKKGLDPVCSALRLFIQESNLVRLELYEVLISPDLFRDRRTPLEGGYAPGADTSALWPSLQSLDITTGPVAPSGEWYTTGDPDDELFAWRSMYSSSDSDWSDRARYPSPTRWACRGHGANDERPFHEWRSRLDSNVFDPLLLSMVTARIPHLESGKMSINYQGSGHRWAYFAFGHKPEEPDKFVRNWMVRMTQGTSWSPPDELPKTVLCYENFHS